MEVTKRDIKRMLMGNLANIDINQVIKDSVKEHEEEIILLNQSQLRQGIKSNGISMGKYANFKYKNRFQPVDLYKSGTLYNKEVLKANIKDFTLDVNSYVVKGFDLGEYLKSVYTPYIFGLTPSSTVFAGELIFPSIKRNFYNLLWK